MSLGFEQKLVLRMTSIYISSHKSMSRFEVLTGFYIDRLVTQISNDPSLR